MNAPTRILSALLLAMAALAAGEAKPAAAPLLVPAEALAAFKAQATAEAAGETPMVVGTWIWGGRADIQYKPFFEWDLRLAAGIRDCQDLRLRIATLGPKQEVLREGTWIGLGTLAASAQRDVAARLNCPTFGAWRCDLAWNGGSAAFVGTDKQTLPVPVSEAKDEPQLITVNASGEPDKTRKTVTVTWNLWNLGGAPASGVVQTVVLKDAAGKVVASGELKADKAALPAHGSRECRLVVANAPDYASVSVQTRQEGEAKRIVLTPKRGEGPDLAVERIVIEAGHLTATVVNHLGRPVAAATVEIVFTSGGKEARTITLPIEALADGATATPSTEVGTLPAWDEFGTSWKMPQ